MMFNSLIEFYERYPKRCRTTAFEVDSCCGLGKYGGTSVVINLLVVSSRVRSERLNNSYYTWSGESGPKPNYVILVALSIRIPLTGTPLNHLFGLVLRHQTFFICTIENCGSSEEDIVRQYYRNKLVLFDCCIA